MKHNFVTSYGLLLGVLCVYYVRIVLFFHFILSRHIFGRNVPTFWGMNIEHVNFGHFSAHLTMTPILMKFWCFSTRKYSLNTARALCESIRTTRSAATLLGFKSFRTFWPSIFGRFLVDFWLFFIELVLCAPTGQRAHLWLIWKVLSYILWIWAFRLISAHFGDFWKTRNNFRSKMDTQSCISGGHFRTAKKFKPHCQITLLVPLWIARGGV